MDEKYIKIYNQGYASLKGKLKPVFCPRCDGQYRIHGECETCLKNLAYNMDYLQTHSFVTDTEVEGYHYSDHATIKSLPLRLPNEHPNLFYGVEDEIEFEGLDVHDDEYYDDCASDDISQIMAEFSRITDGLFVYEWDGSLANGVEIISRPCSYAYWTHPDTVKKLKKGFKYLRDNGAMVKQPTTNGMHIHISRRFFEMSEGDTEKMYQEYDWLFQYFQPEIEKLADRKYTQYCASKADKIKGQLHSSMNVDGANVDVELKATLKKGGYFGCDHYCAVSGRNYTIEARVFKATTDYRHFLANIELVRNFAHASREDSTQKSFDEIIHTKDNLFLDEHIQHSRMLAKKNDESLDLEKKAEAELVVED